MKNDDLIIVRLKGEEIIPFIPELARLRINIFKEYPYLYEGDLNYEYQYLNTYKKCKESIIVLVLHEDVVIGASSAIPLKFETAEIKKPFLDHHINIDDVFYFGESLLLANYRGRNIYRRFFSEREKAAKDHGCKMTAFAAIERAPNDPRRPKDHVPLDDVWRHFGYEKHPELCAYLSWMEIGDKEESPKPLVFWLKTL